MFNIVTLLARPLLHAQEREIVAETEACLDGPQNEIGEGADMLKDADRVVCGDGGGVEKMGSEEH